MMSILNVEDIIERPSATVLNRIVRSQHIDAISPFYSRWSVMRLISRSDSQVRLITRLPSQFASPPPVLDNDPEPLLDAMRAAGGRLGVWAMPDVHAKLYSCDDTAWVGSANLTRNGFSEKGELLLRVSPAGGLADTFRNFVNRSTRVNATNLQYLVDCVARGATRLAKGAKGGVQDAPKVPDLSYSHYGTWLRHQPNSAWLVGRMENNTNMSGHVYSAFFGGATFLMQNRQYAQQLLRGGAVDQPMKTALAGFVTAFGNLISGPRGGVWNKKLSQTLGGTHTNGGAGDVIAINSLPFVALYLRHIGAL